LIKASCIWLTHLNDYAQEYIGPLSAMGIRPTSFSMLNLGILSQIPSWFKSVYWMPFTRVSEEILSRQM